jgi:bifunctional DNase/RNase
VSTLNLTSEQNLTILRRNSVSTRIALHTELPVSVQKSVTQKRVATLNLTSEQNLTIQRKNSSSTRIALHTELPVSVRKSVTQKRVARMLLCSEQNLTMVAVGGRRLQEHVEALALRIEELEKSRA